MSLVGSNFIGRLGRPHPRVPSGLGLEGTSFGSIWETADEEIGAGWFLDRFTYLFGEGINRLLPCVEAWSFLCPPHSDRRVIGRNAYGALLVLDGIAGAIVGGKVWLLDPARLCRFENRNLDLVGLVGDWLPNDRLPGFLDRTLFDTFVAKTGSQLADDEMLGLKVPLPMGGTMTLENVQVENIVAYYQSTAPIYAAHFERRRSLPRS